MSRTAVVLRRLSVSVAGVTLTLIAACSSEPPVDPEQPADGFVVVVDSAEGIDLLTADTTAEDIRYDVEVWGELQHLAAEECLLLSITDVPTSATYPIVWPLETTVLPSGTQVTVAVPGFGAIPVGADLRAGGYFKSPPVPGLPDLPTACRGTTGEVAVIYEVTSAG